MFTRLEGDTAVVVSGGVYKVADLYEREGKLFAAVSGGYVRLYANGSTSKDKLRVDTIAFDAPLFKDRFGRLCVAEGYGRSIMSTEEAETLLLSKD